MRHLARPDLTHVSDGLARARPEGGKARLGRANKPPQQPQGKDRSEAIANPNMRARSLLGKDGVGKNSEGDRPMGDPNDRIPAAAGGCGRVDQP